jgi:hypothetical protein
LHILVVNNFINEVAELRLSYELLGEVLNGSLVSFFTSSFEGNLHFVNLFEDLGLRPREGELQICNEGCIVALGQGLKLYLSGLEPVKALDPDPLNQLNAFPNILLLPSD